MCVCVNPMWTSLVRANFPHLEPSPLPFSPNRGGCFVASLLLLWVGCFCCIVVFIFVASLGCIYVTRLLQSSRLHFCYLGVARLLHSLGASFFREKTQVPQN